MSASLSSPVMISHAAANHVVPVPVIMPSAVSMTYSSGCYRRQLHAGSLSSAQARQALHKLSTGTTPVTSCTTELQDLDEAGQEADLDTLSKQYKGEPPVQQTVITCMTTVKKAYDEVSHLWRSCASVCIGVKLEDRR